MPTAEILFKCASLQLAQASHEGKRIQLARVTNFYSYGYVQFAATESLEKAMAMKGLTVQGRPVKLDVANVSSGKGIFFFLDSCAILIGDADDEKQAKILQFLSQTGTVANGVAYRILEVCPYLIGIFSDFLFRLLNGTYLWR